MSDTFGETLDEKREGGKFKKTVWLTLKPGDVTIRILDPMETKIYGHYFVGRGWVACLGDECLVCQNNKKILYEHPEDYQKVQGWNPRRARFFLNVLDHSDNTVKVLGCGPQLIEDLKVMSKAVRNEQDERIDIRHYDWVISTKGEGRDKKNTPIPKFFGKETTVEVEDGALYDLQNCMVHLSAEEMVDVLNGASIKDVFAIRKAKKQEEEAEFPTADEEALKAEMSENINSLFQG